MRRHLPWTLATLTALLLATTRTLDPTHALLLPLTALTATHLWRHLDDGDQATWPAPPDETRHGARHDLSDLGWAAFTRDGRVSARVTRRVHAIATHRLAHHGIDLDDPTHHPRAARLLGPDVLAGLTSRRPPTPRTLHHWLDALDDLTPHTPDPTPGRPRR
ncbi:hypothetical protein ATJ88_1872 [Isoptericola jiangsuensis]|uniref:Uncharacterized protein n=1 Tax=Isoptericola jiangsuensis TaxID=548579 RepID=A0A2A9EWC4_9MICO|nr:hypothetical protein [Isoptericola jiangsuensis]PFG43188.1 hypothetical protein ATJ88_1872 [Isoptericola jiangsuensis]